MIPYSKQSISQEDVIAVTQALQSSHLTQGACVQNFEQAISQKLGGGFYVLALNSATSALYCAYRALGIQKNDEVITTPNSYVATSNMLLALGVKPVFCDIKWNGNIDENQIESLITPKTKAIVSVDYAGQSVNIEILEQIAKKHKLLWVSDSSHSFGGFYQEKPIGTFADATIFSFHAIKTITTAEGGAIVFKNEQAYEKAKLYHSHGVLKKALWNSEVLEFGFNFRMNELSAALGISQLKRLESFIEKREQIVKYYDDFFANCDSLKTLHRDKHIQSTHHLYPILLNPSHWCAKEEIFKDLQEAGLGVQVHYKPINTYELYKNQSNPTPIAQEFYLSEISIPCHQEMDLFLAKEVAHKIKHIIAKY